MSCAEFKRTTKNLKTLSHETTRKDTKQNNINKLFCFVIFFVLFRG